jgi:hypothetical protein
MGFTFGSQVSELFKKAKHVVVRGHQAPSADLALQDQINIVSCHAESDCEPATNYVQLSNDFRCSDTLVGVRCCAIQALPTPRPDEPLMRLDSLCGVLEHIEAQLDSVFKPKSPADTPVSSTEQSHTHAEIPVVLVDVPLALSPVIPSEQTAEPTNVTAPLGDVTSSTTVPKLDGPPGQVGLLFGQSQNAGAVPLGRD